jgi:hypothetical protein
MPKDSFIIRADGNWVARLAATAVLLQLTKATGDERSTPQSIIVCPPYLCWRCLKLNVPGCSDCEELDMSNSHFDAGFERQVHEVRTSFIQ